MKALILAGGKGTRLSPLTGDTVPKPMAMMDGKPVLLRAVESLKQYGITDFIFTVGHLHEKITDFFGDGSRFGVKIFYLVESSPLGSGGALFYAKDFTDDTLLVCSGDTVFNIDVQRMTEFHRRNHAEITLLVHPNGHPFDSDLIVTDGDRVIDIDFKGNERNYFYENKVNAGFFLFEKTALDFFTEPKKINIEHDFLYHMIKNGHPVYAYSSTEYIKDVGTPDRFAAVENEVRAGIPTARSLSEPQKCVFLDRDGVLNDYRGFIRTSDELTVIPGVGTAIKRLNQAGFLTVLVTNQPVVARGECTYEGLREIHRKLETELGKEGGYLDAIYLCPHHPDSGFEGEVKELKIDCDCRKPKTGMIDAACERFHIDRSRSFMIGDADTDILCGKNAGVTTVRVLSACPAKGNPPADYNANDLSDAIEWIFEREREYNTKGGK